MLKIVINDKYGGYGLSSHALRLIYQRNPDSLAIRVYRNQADSEFARHPKADWDAFLAEHCTPMGDGAYVAAVWDTRVVVRRDPTLVAVVEELGAKANGQSAELKVVRVEDEWVSIREHGGLEFVSG